MSGVEQSAPSVPSVADTPSSSRLHVTEADDAVGEAPMGGRKYLAMCWNRSGLGHAVFDKDSGVIGVGECREFESFLNVLQLKEDASPISIVVPTGSDARFVAAAKKPLSSGHAVDVSVVSRAEFVAESCAEKLAPDLHLTEPACRQYLERNVDMRAQQALRALSGLLSRVLGIAPITKVQQQCSSVLMAVDPTTLEALQVFKRVAHPSAHNGIGVPKEGLSVFGLLNTCRTRMGTEVLKQWLHSPTHDTAVLNARLSAIDVLVAPHNQDVVAHLRSHLRFLRNPDELLRRFQEYSRSVRHWQTLLQLLHSLPVVVEICRQLSQGAQAPVFRDIVNAFHEEQTALLFQRVADTVDVAASQCSGRVIVKWGVNDELDKHREAYEGLRGFLDVVAQSVSQDLQPFAHPISVDYYPQLGYFVTVGIAYFNSNLTTNLPNPNYQYQFKSEEKLFYKSSRMRELDEQYGDIYSAIVDMETEAVDELTGFVLEPHNVAVLGAVRPTATLDCLLAMATVSREERWCRPTVVGDSVLRIVEGRHPVQEKVVEAFVPNDTSSGTEGRICIVTGPNASGKSVYIKQVALIVFLAHIGCYVPAREAVVGATDRIFTRIRSRKASPSAKDCSAFASDLTDILDMMKYSTDKSLLVIDEFGKGTVTADGMALLAAVVRHFLAKGDACPRVLISTHYVEILNERLVPRCPLLAVSHMAVERDLMHEDEIVFRYKLRRGVSESSFALYCAAQAGVPQNVLARASFLHKLLKKVPPSAFKGILSSTPATHAAHLSVLRLLAGSLETCDAAALAQQIHRAVQDHMHDDKNATHLTLSPCTPKTRHADHFLHTLSTVMDVSPMTHVSTPSQQSRAGTEDGRSSHAGGGTSVNDKAAEIALEAWRSAKQLKASRLAPRSPHSTALPQDTPPEAVCPAPATHPVAVRRRSPSPRTYDEVLRRERAQMLREEQDARRSKDPAVATKARHTRLAEVRKRYSDIRLRSPSRSPPRIDMAQQQQQQQQRRVSVPIVLRELQGNTPDVRSARPDKQRSDAEEGQAGSVVLPDAPQSPMQVLLQRYREEEAQAQEQEQAQPSRAPAAAAVARARSRASPRREEAPVRQDASALISATQHTRHHSQAQEHSTVRYSARPRGSAQGTASGALDAAQPRTGGTEKAPTAAPVTQSTQSMQIIQSRQSTQSMQSLRGTQVTQGQQDVPAAGVPPGGAAGSHDMPLSLSPIDFVAESVVVSQVVQRRSYELVDMAQEGVPQGPPAGLEQGPGEAGSDHDDHYDDGGGDAGGALDEGFWAEAPRRSLPVDSFGQRLPLARPPTPQHRLSPLSADASQATLRSEPSTGSALHGVVSINLYTESEAAAERSTTQSSVGDNDTQDDPHATHSTPHHLPQADQATKRATSRASGASDVGGIPFNAFEPAASCPPLPLSRPLDAVASEMQMICRRYGIHTAGLGGAGDDAGGPLAPSPAGSLGEPACPALQQGEGVPGGSGAGSQHSPRSFRSIAESDAAPQGGDGEGVSVCDSLDVGHRGVPVEASPAHVAVAGAGAVAEAHPPSDTSPSVGLPFDQVMRSLLPRYDKANRSAGREDRAEPPACSAAPAASRSPEALAPPSLSPATDGRGAGQAAGLSPEAAWRVSVGTEALSPVTHEATTGTDTPPAPEGATAVAAAAAGCQTEPAGGCQSRGNSPIPFATPPHRVLGERHGMVLQPVSAPLLSVARALSPVSVQTVSLGTHGPLLAKRVSRTTSPMPEPCMQSVQCGTGTGVLDSADAHTEPMPAALLTSTCGTSPALPFSRDAEVGTSPMADVADAHTETALLRHAGTSPPPATHTCDAGVSPRLLSATGTSPVPICMSESTTEMDRSCVAATSTDAPDLCDSFTMPQPRADAACSAEVVAASVAVGTLPPEVSESFTMSEQAVAVACETAALHTHEAGTVTSSPRHAGTSPVRAVMHDSFTLAETSVDMGTSPVDPETTAATTETEPFLEAGTSPILPHMSTSFTEPEAGLTLDASTSPHHHHCADAGVSPEQAYTPPGMPQGDLFASPPFGTARRCVPGAASAQSPPPSGVALLLDAAQGPEGSAAHGMLYDVLRTADLGRRHEGDDFSLSAINCSARLEGRRGSAELRPLPDGDAVHDSLRVFTGMLPQAGAQYDDASSASSGSLNVGRRSRRQPRQLRRMSPLSVPSTPGTPVGVEVAAAAVVSVSVRRAEPRQLRELPDMEGMPAFQTAVRAAERREQVLMSQYYRLWRMRHTEVVVRRRASRAVLRGWRLQTSSVRHDRRRVAVRLFTAWKQRTAEAVAVRQSLCDADVIAKSFYLRRMKRVAQRAAELRRIEEQVKARHAGYAKGKAFGVWTASVMQRARRRQQQAHQENARHKAVLAVETSRVVASQHDVVMQSLAATREHNTELLRVNEELHTRLARIEDLVAQQAQKGSEKKQSRAPSRTRKKTASDSVERKLFPTTDPSPRDLLHEYIKRELRAAARRQPQMSTPADLTTLMQQLATSLPKELAAAGEESSRS